jgi:hypothetical protein
MVNHITHFNLQPPYCVFKCLSAYFHRFHSVVRPEGERGYLALWNTNCARRTVATDAAQNHKTVYCSCYWPVVSGVQTATHCSGATRSVCHSGGVSLLTAHSARSTHQLHWVRDVNNCSYSQENRRLLWKLQIHYRVQNSQPSPCNQIQTKHWHLHAVFRVAPFECCPLIHTETSLELTQMCSDWTEAEILSHVVTAEKRFFSKSGDTIKYEAL